MRATNFVSARLSQWRMDTSGRLWWQRTLIIMAVLVMSVGLAYKLPPQFAIYVLALPVVIVGISLLLRWPPLGLLILITASLAFPLEIIYVIGITAIIVLGLTMLWVMDMFVLKRQISLMRSPTILSLIIFMLVSIVAFGNGQLPWYPITSAPLNGQLGGLLILLVAICAFLLVAHQVRDIRWLKRMVFVFLAIGAIFVMGRIIPGMTRRMARFFSPEIASGSMFWLWIVAMSFSQAAFNRRLDIRWRAVLAGLALSTLYVVLVPARAWISGWFPALLAVFIIFWLGAPRKAYLATLVGGMILITQIQTVINRFLLIGDNEYSQLTRLEAWRIIAEIVKVSPFLGLGPANYSYYTPLFPILGYYVQFNSHNNYVDIIAQSGLIGLAVFLWFVWEIGKLGWRLRAMTPKGGFTEAYVLGTLGGLVATFMAGMLGDWFLPYVYNATIRAMRTTVMPWLFMGGLLAIEQILLARAKEGGEPAAELD